MVLSGALLTFWAAVGIGTFVAKATRRVKAARLSEDELALLVLMGEHIHKPLDLERLEGVDRLTALDICGRLEAKGLVVMNRFDCDLVSLTKSGRRRALEMINEKRPASAA